MAHVLARRFTIQAFNEGASLSGNSMVPAADRGGRKGGPDGGPGHSMTMNPDLTLPRRAPGHNAGGVVAAKLARRRSRVDASWLPEKFPGQST